MSTAYKNNFPTFTKSLSLLEEEKVTTIIQNHELPGIVRIMGALAEYILEKTNSDMCRGVLSFATDLYEEVEPEVAYQALVQALNEYKYESIEPFVRQQLSLINNPEYTSERKLSEVKRLIKNLSHVGIFL